MEVVVVGFFCSRCKREWLQTQTGSSVSITESLRSHQDERCEEQWQREEGKIKFIGYYCASCNRKWLLKECKENTDVATSQHHETACPERDTFEDIKVTGYFCSMCKKEWSLQEVGANPSQVIVNEIRSNLHTRCNEEIQRRVQENVIDYFCDRCNRKWQLLESSRNPVSTMGNVYHECRGFLDDIKTYEDIDYL